jgi:hypothetical protein
MKINLRNSISGLFLAVTLISTAQVPFNMNSERCGSGILHKKLMATDPQYAAKFQINEAQIQEIINSGERSAGTYNIPVVVHVMHLGEAIGTGTNISVAQINSAIANLNACYSGTGGYPQNVDVHFQLAQRDRNCNATTGIVRVNASATSGYGTNGITSANETTIKALSIWPNSEYVNIWIVSEIDNNDGGAGTQGYAYFPGASSDKDGIVALYNAFGYDPTGTLGYNLKSYTNRNLTANHEFGHVFNLYHTFEGDDGDNDGTADQCPVNDTCSTQGDKCCDTEAHERDLVNVCGSTGVTCTGQSATNVVQNIMNYCSETCQTKFSADQKTRMRAAISGPRASLLTSPGLLAVTGSSPLVTKTCFPQSTILSGGFGMGVFGLTIGGTSYSSSGTEADGGFRNNWCSNFSLNVNTSYSIQVNNGTQNPEKVKVYIDYNNDGDFLDAGENVYSDNTGAFSHSGNFTTPASPVTGQAIWVRVISDFVNNTISGPCYAPQYGQVEDFSVTISSGVCTPPTITGTTPNSRCGTGTVVLGATASAGTLSWYAASTGGTGLHTGTTYTTPSISATTTYYVSATSAGCTSARTAVIATVNATPTVASTTPGNNCGTGTIVLGATTSAGTLNWYSVSTGGTSLGTGTSFTTPSISANTTYYVSTINSGCASTPRTPVLATINTMPVVSSVLPGTICSAGSVVLHAASTGTLNWFAASTGGSSLGTGSAYTTPSIGSTTIYYVGASNGACTSARTAVTATVNAPTVTSTTPNSHCGAGQVALAATASSGTLKWYNASTGGSMVGSGASYTTQNINTTATYYVSATNGSCISARTAVVATINAAPTITGITSNTHCGAGTEVLGATASAGSLNWYAASTGGSSLGSGTSFTTPSIGTTTYYYVEATNGGCTSTRTAVTAAVTCTGSFVPTTNVLPSQCGQTIANLNGDFQCVGVSGAQDYEWLIENTSLGYSVVRTRGSAVNSIQKTLFPNLQFGVAYTVHVRAKVAGVWGDYGAACVLTMASTIPTTKVSTTQCGGAVTGTSALLVADVVAGAQDYQWKLINTISGDSIVANRVSAINTMNVSLFPGLQFGVTYNVTVRAKVGGNWANFGPTCAVGIFGALFAPTYHGDNNRSSTTTINNDFAEENTEAKLLVYPNPSGTTGFNINLEGISEFNNDIIVEVYDMYGKRVFANVSHSKESSQTLKINNDGRLATGIYIVNVMVNGKTLHEKVIVK